jgi:5-methylcytosine-specific restriction endonuclease McrA
MALKPCLTCGELSESSYCAEHQPYRPRGKQLAKLRTRAFGAYGRRCFECGRSDLELELHHVNGDPMDNRIANTIPLCLDCHRSPEMHR